MKQAVILAGGMGTRLRSVVSDVPKPMAPINGRPFLEYLFDYLISQNVRDVILSVGYKHKVIQDYFGKSYGCTKIEYSIEQELLGTGGAIKKALSMAKEDNIIVLNGDTYFPVNITELMAFHSINNNDISLSGKIHSSARRFGSLKVKGSRIVEFRSNSSNSIGLINGGVYVVKRDVFDETPFQNKFSFEIDFLASMVEKLRVGVCVSQCIFIDIGCPKDYEIAKAILPNSI